MTDNKEKKSTRGGARPGAGRPANDSRLYAFRAGGDIARFLDSHPNKTLFIRHCLERERLRHEGAELKAPCFESATQASDVNGETLPYFDLRVVAGFPVPLDTDEAAQDIDILRMLCPTPEATYLVRVKGESMRDADIRSGDILVIDRSMRQPTERQVALCELNGEYTVKYVARRGEGLSLVPANARYPEIPVKAGDDFSVWGTVTYVIHKPRPEGAKSTARGKGEQGKQ